MEGSLLIILSWYLADVSIKWNFGTWLMEVQPTILVVKLICNTVCIFSSLLMLWNNWKDSYTYVLMQWNLGTRAGFSNCFSISSWTAFKCRSVQTPHKPPQSDSLVFCHTQACLRHQAIACRWFQGQALSQVASPWSLYPLLSSVHCMFSYLACHILFWLSGYLGRWFGRKRHKILLCIKHVARKQWSTGTSLCKAEIVALFLTVCALLSDHISPCSLVPGCPRKITPDTDKLIRCETIKNHRH